MKRRISKLIAGAAVIIIIVLLLKRNYTIEAGSETKSTQAQVQIEPYTRLGCYRDTEARVMKTALGDINPWSYDICYAKAKAGGFKYFGRQYNYQCFASRDDYNSAGSATNCDYLGGDGSWVNEVYKIN